MYDVHERQRKNAICMYVRHPSDSNELKINIYKHHLELQADVVREFVLIHIKINLTICCNKK